MSREVSDRVDVLLSAQRALTGVVGLTVLGACVAIEADSVLLQVYAEASLTDDEREDWEVAITEMMADLLDKRIDLEIYDDSSSTLTGCSDIWLFVRRNVLTNNLN